MELTYRAITVVRLVRILLVSRPVSAGRPLNFVRFRVVKERKCNEQGRICRKASENHLLENRFIALGAGIVRVRGMGAVPERD